MEIDIDALRWYFWDNKNFYSSAQLIFSTSIKQCQPTQPQNLFFVNYVRDEYCVIINVADDADFPSWTLATLKIT